MEKIVEEQSIRSERLMKAFDIVKVIDDPRIDHLLSTLTSRLSRAEELLAKRRSLIKRNQKLKEELRDGRRNINVHSEKLEKITQKYFHEQSNVPTQSQDNNQVRGNGTRVNIDDVFEVSPCPSEWANGALDTPLPRRRFLSQSVSSLPEDVQNLYIKFLDAGEMRSVPGYMKGRLTCENVNNLIETMNSVLKKKYDIVNLKRKDVKRKDLIQYTSWKSQEEEYKMIGKIFFTAEDLATLGNTKMDKMADKMTQVLRHTKRLRQSQVSGKLVLYILV